MYGLAVILAIAAVMIWKTLFPMLRRGEIRDGFVYSVLLLGGIAFSVLAASLRPMPAPIHILVTVFHPFSHWLFTAMRWKG